MKINVEINPDIITAIGEYLCKSKGTEKNDALLNVSVDAFLASVLCATIAQCNEQYDEIMDMQDACFEASSCL